MPPPPRGGNGRGAAYHRHMDAVVALVVAPVLAAMVWHYWIAVPLVAGALLLIVALVVGYLKKVESLKYPRQ